LKTIVQRAPIWGNTFLPTRASVEPFERASDLARSLGLEDLDPSGSQVAVEAEYSIQFVRFGEDALQLIDGLFLDLFTTVWDLKVIGLCDLPPRDAKIPIPSAATMAKLQDVTSRFERLGTIIARARETSSSEHQRTGAQEPSRWKVDERIIETLRGVGHRLTTTKLLGEMEPPEWTPSESTAKKRLATLVKAKRLTNDPKSKPPGYGLPEWAVGSSGS
jgi:hypothetical protein